MFEQIFESVGRSFLASVPVIVMIFWATLALLNALGKDFRDVLLGEDRVGWNLIAFGIGFCIVAWIVPSGKLMIALSTYGVSLVLFGALVAIPDDWTKRLFNGGWTLILYSLCTVGVFAITGFAVYPFAGFNTITFADIGANIFIATILLTVGTISATFSDQLKSKLMPMDNHGLIIIAIALITLLMSLMSANPILLVAFAMFSAMWAVLGGLIVLPPGLTFFIMNRNNALFVLVVALVLFLI